MSESHQLICLQFQLQVPLLTGAAQSSKPFQQVLAENGVSVVEGSGVGKEGISLNSIVGTILNILSLVLYFCGWKKKAKKNHPLSLHLQKHSQPLRQIPSLKTDTPPIAGTPMSKSHGWFSRSRPIPSTVLRLWGSQKQAGE